MFIQRDSIALPFPLKAKRDQISVSSLDVAYMIEPTVAFIRIRRFGLKTAEEFRNAIIELKKQGAKNLILDLRDNGGGYFHIAIKLASEFFADQRLVVYTEGAHEARRDLVATRDGLDLRLIQAPALFGLNGRHKARPAQTCQIGRMPVATRFDKGVH